MLVGMNEHAGSPAFEIVPTTLDTFRFYSAGETAEIFAATVEALDEWVQGVPRQLYCRIVVNQFCRFTSSAWPRCWAASVR